MLKSWLISFLVLFAVTPTYAHGPQMQIDVVNGKLVTRSVLTDVYTPLTDPTRLYVLPVTGVTVTTPIAGTEWRPSPSPGFAYEYAAALAGSTIDIGFTGGLQTWNGTAFVDAGTAQMQAYKTTGVGRSTISVDGGLSATALVTTAAAVVPADAHSGLTYKLLGDGIDPTSSLADGIYLIGLQVSSNAAGVAASDPFYFLLNKNVDQATFGPAYASFVGSQGFSSAQVQAFTAVPEPSTWALMLSGAGVLLVIRRRRAV